MNLVHWFGGWAQHYVLLTLPLPVGLFDELFRMAIWIGIMSNLSTEQDWRKDFAVISCAGSL